jgi:hypothetical protein
MRQIRTALSFVAGIFVLLGLATAQDQADPPLANASALPSEMAERQRQAIVSMPSARVTYHQGGTVRSIRGETGIRISSAARALRKGESGKDVLAALRNVILVSGQEELTLVTNTSSFETQRALTLSQSIAGIPVISGSVGVVVESSSGLVVVLNSSFLPDRNLPRTPKLTRDEAKEAARKALYTMLGALPESVTFSDEPPALAYVGRNDAVDREALVWVFTASYLTDKGQGPRQGYLDLWINAVTGESFPGLAT